MVIFRMVAISVCVLALAIGCIKSWVYCCVDWMVPFSLIAIIYWVFISKRLHDWAEKDGRKK